MQNVLRGNHGLRTSLIAPGAILFPGVFRHRGGLCQRLPSTADDGVEEDGDSPTRQKNYSQVGDDAYLPGEDADRS